MDHLLRNLPFARCYLDDIIVASTDHDQYLDYIHQLFEMFYRAGLRISLDKYAFGKNEVNYLSYLDSECGFKPPASKIQPINDFP